MKSKIIMACMLCLLLTNKMYGSTPKVAYAFNKVILDFIDSHMNSDYRKLNEVLNADASLKIPRGESVLVQHKSDLIDQMRQNKGVQQNCKSKYEVLAESSAMVIARVDFKYESCTQHDYVILEKNEDKQWKITQVCKMFEDVKEPAATGDVTASN